MERFTELTKNGRYRLKSNYGFRWRFAESNAQEPINKLGEYEDLEEQGLLLKLPCKVGDKAWYVRNCVIDEVEVDSFILNINLLVNVSLYVGYERFRKTLTPYKTLFFTRDEAEQKLEELKELSK